LLSSTNWSLTAGVAARSRAHRGACGACRPLGPVEYDKEAGLPARVRIEARVERLLPVTPMRARSLRPRSVLVFEIVRVSVTGPVFASLAVRGMSRLFRWK